MQYTKITKGRLPITMELARAHLRVGDATHEEALIESKLEMAVGVAEDLTGRLIWERSVEFDVLLNPGDQCIPLQIHTSEVTEVSYLGNILSEDSYVFLPGGFSQQIMLLEAEKYEGSKLTVKCRLGYDKDSIPPTIKAAILLLLGTLYDNEADIVVGRTPSELSLTAEKLLTKWRVNPYGNV